MNIYYVVPSIKKDYFYTITPGHVKQNAVVTQMKVSMNIPDGQTTRLQKGRTQTRKSITSGAREKTTEEHSTKQSNECSKQGARLPYKISMSLSWISCENASHWHYIANPSTL